jgi:hypothetical protein
MRFAADNLSMLMSSDWFMDAWELCGLHPSSVSRSLIQKKCRLIVEKIVGGCSTYWDAEFSERRGAETKNQLIQVLDAAHLARSDMAICERYLDGKDDIEGELVHPSLVPTLFSLFVSEHRRGEGLPGQFRRDSVMRIEEALEAVNSEQPIVEAGSNISSKWDRWLGSLTPDIPSFTVDVARELAQYAGPHTRLAAALKVVLTAEELSQLDRWLQASAEELAGVQLPPILDES